MANIYVATTGNDANPGTIGSPKLTGTGACAIMSAGDTIWFRGGTYNAVTLTGLLGGTTTNWSTTASGATWIRAYTGETVLWTGATGFNLDGYTAVVFDDISVDRAGFSLGSIFRITNSSHIRIQDCSLIDSGAGNGMILCTHQAGKFEYVEILRNNISYPNQSHIDNGAASHGIYLAGSAGVAAARNVDLHCLIKGNTIHHCTSVAPYANLSYGIQCYGGSESNQLNGIIIEDNYITLNTNGVVVWGSQIAGSVIIRNNLVTNHTLRSIQPDICVQPKIYNNTIDTAAIGIYVGPNGLVNDALITNNEITFCTTAIEVTSVNPASYVTATYNSVYGSGGTANGMTDANGLSTITHAISGYPVWVGSGDYQHQASSPCVDSGTNLSPDVTDDYNGVTRTAPYDIGCFEYVPSATPAPPVINSSTSTSGVVNIAFTYNITATNSPSSYGVTGTLPSGLSLNTGTGAITGTPTITGTTGVTISATNGDGTGMASLSITITPVSRRLLKVRR